MDQQSKKDRLDPLGMNSEILTKVLSGDAQAYRYFVDKYGSMAFSIAISIVKNPEEAEEVVQDAFLNAYNALSAFQKRSKFSTWFYKIVVNEGLKKLRKKRIKFAPAEEIETGYVTDEYELNQSLSTLKQDEQKQFINLALGKMAPRDSLIMRLFYLEERDIREVADIMGLSKTNVKTLLFRSRKRFYCILKKELKNELKSIL